MSLSTSSTLSSCRARIEHDSLSSLVLVEGLHPIWACACAHPSLCRPPPSTTSMRTRSHAPRPPPSQQIRSSPEPNSNPISIRAPPRSPPPPQKCVPNPAPDLTIPSIRASISTSNLGDLRTADLPDSRTLRTDIGSRGGRGGGGGGCEWQVKGTDTDTTGSGKLYTRDEAGIGGFTNHPHARTHSPPFPSLDRPEGIEILSLDQHPLYRHRSTRNSELGVTGLETLGHRIPERPKRAKHQQDKRNNKARNKILHHSFISIRYHMYLYPLLCQVHAAMQSCPVKNADTVRPSLWKGTPPAQASHNTVGAIDWSGEKILFIEVTQELQPSSHHHALLVAQNPSYIKPPSQRNFWPIVLGE